MDNLSSFQAFCGSRLNSNQTPDNRNKLFNDFKNARYNHILSHEQAHKSTGGALAGPIVIEKDVNGVAFAGHVNIKMPSLDKNNPQKTIKEADTVKAAALAPSDPSGQDLKVASQAQSIKFQAINLQRSFQNGNSLDYMA